MKWSKSISTGLLTQATSGAASAGQDSQPAGESQVGSKALLRLVVVGLVLVAGLAAWLFWNWYSSGYQRDQVRLQHLQQLMVFLQNYQSQTAVFPFSHNWSEFVGLDSQLTGLQDPKSPARFYVYCPAENGYVVAAWLERPALFYPEKNLSAGVALNNCLTSTGIRLQSFRCSQTGSNGEINGQVGQVFCLGNL